MPRMAPRRRPLTLPVICALIALATGALPGPARAGSHVPGELIVKIRPGKSVSTNRAEVPSVTLD